MNDHDDLLGSIIEDCIDTELQFRLHVVLDEHGATVHWVAAISEPGDGAPSVSQTGLTARDAIIKLQDNWF